MIDHKKAYKEAQDELQKESIKEVKEIMKSVLQEIQRQKEIKERAEDSLRLLKLDLDDLREGKIDKIRQRHQTEKAKMISPIKENHLEMLQSVPLVWTGGMSGTFIGTTTGTNLSWNEATSGVYAVNCSNGTVKEFYL